MIEEKFFKTFRVPAFGLKAYKLNKDNKAENVSAIELPPEVTRTDSKIDTQRLLQQKFGESIINFVNTITDKMPDADLTLLYNNLGTLTTSKKNFNLRNIVFGGSTTGEYSAPKNEIQVQESDYFVTLPHELFHMASSYYRENDKTKYTGFVQFGKGKATLAEGINEGYTQLLTERYFGINEINVYPYEKVVAGNLEVIVGKEKMESLYMNANLNGLVQELKQYADVTAIRQFFTDVDFLSAHLDDVILLPKEKSMITSKMTNVNQFLTGSYMKKINIDFNGAEFDNKRYSGKLATFLAAMVWGIKTTQREYLSESSEKIVKNAYESLLIKKLAEKDEERTQG